MQIPSYGEDTRTDAVLSIVSVLTVRYSTVIYIRVSGEKLRNLTWDLLSVTSRIVA